MKAIIFSKYGSPEVLQIQEVSKPTPKDSQILVEMVANAVNSRDVIIF
jgi:NADPH:quinone reductase-like Zn-dependent oxidoreductase